MSIFLRSVYLDSQIYDACTSENNECLIVLLHVLLCIALPFVSGSSIIKFRDVTRRRI